MSKQGYEWPDRKDFWEKACSRMQKPKGKITFAAGNDAAQMLGAWQNWSRWGYEERGREISHAGFVEAWMEKCRSGTFLQVIGWDGVEPIAMVELRTIYDPLFGETTLYGDHAFVKKDYRYGGLMKQMVQYCIDLAEIMGMVKWLVPVTAGEDATAPFLKKVYEDFGFEVSGMTMKLDKVA